LIPGFGLHTTGSLGTMTSSRARLRLFMAEAAGVVTKTASSIADGADMKCLVQVYEDRRGWEIHTMVAVEDQHGMEELLNVAKANLQEACHSASCVCLVSNTRHTWKNVHCGFRALMAFVDDESRAGMPICELEHCPNPACPNQHPTRIKRLYVMVKTNMVTPQVDSNDNALENLFSFSSSVPSAASALSTLSALSTQSAGSVQSAGSSSSIVYSMSGDCLLGDDDCIAGAEQAHPMPLHVSHGTNFEQPRVQARPPDQSSFDLLSHSNLRPSCVISL